MEENINTAIKQAIEDAPERKFVQSVDIAFTIKDVDLKNPTNRINCLLYTSPSPRDLSTSRMPSSA